MGETYHVGSGVERSIEEIADGVLAALGKPESLKTIVPDRPGHDRRYLLDSSKIASELGWKPTVSFEQGLAETVHWYAANRAWWEPLRERAPVEESKAWDEPVDAQSLDLLMRVLVTGAGGQLGREVVDAFSAGSRHEVVACDHDTLDVGDRDACCR